MALSKVLSLKEERSRFLVLGAYLPRMVSTSTTMDPLPSQVCISAYVGKSKRATYTPIEDDTAQEHGRSAMSSMDISIMSSRGLLVGEAALWEVGAPFLPVYIGSCSRLFQQAM